MSDQDNFYVIGHRGAAGLVAENTLAGFEYAWQIGLKAIELDVHLSEDQLIVIHDTTLERTTDGRGKLVDHSFAALRLLDAGGSQQIPTLEEVLDAAPVGVTINIELKGRNTAKPVTERIPHYPKLNFLVSSFYHDQLTTFRQLNDTTPVAPLFNRWQDNIVATARELDATTINLSLKITNNKRVAMLKKEEFRVLVYTVNTVRTARKLKNMGVAGVFSDYPDRLQNKI